jgi:hypothetical protein
LRGAGGRFTIGAMSALSSLNDEAARFIAGGRLDEAQEVLERAGGILEARGPAVPDARDLDPAFDEYFWRSHRLHVAWLRCRYAEALPHAERAFALEKEIVAAARAARMNDLAPVAFSMGAWGLVSVLTRLKRFDEARDVFAQVIGDEGFFRARHARERSSAQKILVAGLCVFFEKEDESWMKAGRRLVAKAQRLVRAEDPELAYGYACYWARLGEVEAACDALGDSLRLGVDPERMLADEDLRGLHQDARFLSVVGERVFTFKVSSHPPGARIFVDEADTGLCTPARLRPPPPGRHLIRLTLEGHRDAEHWHEQEKGAGLDLSLGLESLTDAAARRKLEEDAARPVDEAAREHTRAFLGSEKDRLRARIAAVRHTTYGLGELALTVHGDGRVTARHLDFASPRKTHESSARLEVDEVRQLFDAFVEEAFTKLVVAPHCGVPDELFFTIELSNAKGEAHQVGKFVGADHRRFTRLLDLVHEAVAGHLDARTRKRLTI